MIPVISFVGRHNSGKTTLLTKIIERFSQKDIKTAVIKHAASGLDINPDNDSGRLFNAGASRVYASSPGIAMEYHRNNEEISLKDICSKVGLDVDLVITEGFKKETHPKIEVLRSSISKKTMDLTNVIARVADFDLDDYGGALPVFKFNQDKEITEFIINLFNFKKGK